MLDSIVFLHDVLSRQEELILVRRIKDGLEPSETLVLSNLRLALSVANQYRHLSSSLTIDDLFQEAVLGLMRAVQTFDSDRGYRFSTYATPWVEHYLRNAICDKHRLIRIPRYLEDKLCKLQQFGKQSYENESARRKMCVAAASSLTSASFDSNETVLGRLPDRDGSCNIAAIQDAIIDALGTLEPIKATIVRQRFGLDDNKSMTFKSIAMELGISKDITRQMYYQAIGELSAFFS